MKIDLLNEGPEQASQKMFAMANHIRNLYALLFILLFIIFCMMVCIFSQKEIIKDYKSKVSRDEHAHQSFKQMLLTQ